jgi:hypothetical protein
MGDFQLLQGRTTARLVNAIDDRYTDIEKFLGEEYARLTAQSHTAATDCAEEIAREHKIECNFERVDGYLFLPPGGSVTGLMKELDAIHRAGLVAVERVDSVPNTKIHSERIIDAIFESTRASRAVTLPRFDKIDAFRGPPPA